MSTAIRAASAATEPHPSELDRASTVFGLERGYYRLLFEAGPVDVSTFAALAGIAEHEAQTWLEEQASAGVLRVVVAPSGEGDELLLPGEYVPILLGDHGGTELQGARAMLDVHRADAERVRTLAEGARLARAVWSAPASPS
ncbi:hypothetical protein [Agromyces sp. Marseille-P2726]|uniref:hypothetical protein n=1 Tax=Agromyces sp. Marseille-P2726 TaxID=2709132 RepID=UPI00156DE9C8|nr:hypothetical protein [Agromyces sp. Marseille-P2726]